MRNKKRIKRVLRQWIQQLEKIVNTCRVSIDRFLSKLIHQSTIERAALRNYTLINPINSLVDNSLRRQNFCIFERRIPRMLHKSFPATLSNSTDAYTSPILYPLSLSLFSIPIGLLLHATTASCIFGEPKRAIFTRDDRSGSNLESDSVSR